MVGGSLADSQEKNRADFSRSRAASVDSKESRSAPVAAAGVSVSGSQREGGQREGGQREGGQREGGLWEVFAQKIAECGVELFDMELPASRFGTLRIFITRPKDKLTQDQVGSKDTALAVSSVADSGEQHSAEKVATDGVSLADSEATGDEIEAVLPGEARVGGVIIEDCAKVSKHLQQFMDSVGGDTLGLSGHDWNLEVSSPGINRALRRAEHFAGAVGERVRVRFTRSESVVVEVCAPGEARSKPIQPKEVIRSPSKRGARPSPEALAKEAEKMSKKGIITGTLCAFEAGVLVVEDDRGILRASIPLHLVREARVDFLFS